MEEDDSFPVFPTSPGPADAGNNGSEFEQQSEAADAPADGTAKPGMEYAASLGIKISDSNREMNDRIAGIVKDNGLNWTRDSHTPADGNCFYHAVAQHLRRAEIRQHVAPEKRDLNYRQLREACTKFLLNDFPSLMNEAWTLFKGLHEDENEKFPKWSVRWDH